jgi:hypothetical protein
MNDLVFLSMVARPGAKTSLQAAEPRNLQKTGSICLLRPY